MNSTFLINVFKTTSRLFTEPGGLPGGFSLAFHENQAPAQLTHLQSNLWTNANHYCHCILKNQSNHSGCHLELHNESISVCQWIVGYLGATSDSLGWPLVDMPIKPISVQFCPQPPEQSETRPVILHGVQVHL